MSVRKWAVVAAASVFVTVSLLAGAGAILCAGTLHVPKSRAATPANTTNIDVGAKDGVNLSAWWLRAPHPNGNCVIVLHGVGDSRASGVGFAPMFLASGYAVLAPDSRAHGASGGAFVTYGLLEKYDVIAWANWMKDAGCRKIYGLGESLGGSILIQTAGLGPVFAAVVAECPYADLREIAAYRVRHVLPMPASIAAPLATLAVADAMFYANLVDGLDFSQVDPIASIARAATPILLIHGLTDSRTPPSHSLKLAAANPKDALWLVPNTGHTQASTIRPEEFGKRVLGFFADH